MRIFMINQNGIHIYLQQPLRKIFWNACRFFQRKVQTEVVLRHVALLGLSPRIGQDLVHPGYEREATIRLTSIQTA